jgi:hypothetical protein
MPAPRTDYVGGTTLETVRAYVEAQGTEKQTRKTVAKTKAARLTSPLSVGFV